MWLTICCGCLPELASLITKRTQPKQIPPFETLFFLSVFLFKLVRCYSFSWCLHSLKAALPSTTTTALVSSKNVHRLNFINTVFSFISSSFCLLLSLFLLFFFFLCPSFCVFSWGWQTSVNLLSVSVFTSVQTPVVGSVYPQEMALFVSTHPPMCRQMSGVN